jgi:hypothetical protein
MIYIIAIATTRVTAATTAVMLALTWARSENPASPSPLSDELSFESDESFFESDDPLDFDESSFESLLEFDEPDDEPLPGFA